MTVFVPLCPWDYTQLCTCTCIVTVGLHVATKVTQPVRQLSFFFFFLSVAGPHKSSRWCYSYCYCVIVKRYGGQRSGVGVQTVAAEVKVSCSSMQLINTGYYISHNASLLKQSLHCQIRGQGGEVIRNTEVKSDGLCDVGWWRDGGISWIFSHRVSLDAASKRLLSVMKMLLWPGDTLQLFISSLQTREGDICTH